MAKKNTNDIIGMITRFQDKIIKRKPSVSKMFSEIRMMRFKIRPVQGDISLLNLNNQQFIEILWSLGKLDEFFQEQYKKIASRDRELFLKLFDGIHDKFQKQLNSLNLKPEKNIETSQTFEMEIYKERIGRRN